MNLETQVKELKKEISRLSKERDDYKDALNKRPFEIKAKAEIIDVNNHPKLTKLIQDKLINNERFLVKVLIENERLWILPFGFADYKNELFLGSDEIGEIFVGLLDNNPINENLNFNDMVQFQSCDVIAIRNLS